MDIYQSISAVMSDLEPIAKSKKNAQQGFLYRGVDDVMNALQPLFAKHHIFVVPEVQEQKREERQSSRGGVLIYSICKVKYSFYAEDGTSVSAVVIGEGMDSGDKATNKAMSVAFKYACFQVFCIPTEEMRDPDAEVHDVKPRQNRAAKSSTGDTITKEEKERLTALCRDKWGDRANAMYKQTTGLNHMNLTKGQYADVLAAIEGAAS